MHLYKGNAETKKKKNSFFGSRFEFANCGNAGEQTTTATFSENEGVPTITKTTLCQPTIRHRLFYVSNNTN